MRDETLPDDLAGLVEDLCARGFRISEEQWHPWPGGGDIVLEAPSGAALEAVRLLEDRGLWETSVKLGRSWFDTYTALRAIDGQAHEQRALNHEERRRSTIEFVDRFKGTREQRRAVKQRWTELRVAWTQRFRGDGLQP